METKRESASDTWAEIQALKELTVRELESARRDKEYWEDRVRDQHRVKEARERLRSKTEMDNIIEALNHLLIGRNIKIIYNEPKQYRPYWDNYSTSMFTIEEITIPTVPAEPKQIDRTGINPFREFINKCFKDRGINAK